jgi:nucleoside-diphosphate-sugar epimerase
MKNKYLVCGAGGFIGGHLVKSLLDDGHEVSMCRYKTFRKLVSNI